MTTSIAFDILDCGSEISFNNDITLDPAETSWLLDPNSPRDALQRLRILKTRETGSVQQIPNTVGRVRSLNLNIGQDYTYETLKMRRKAQILKYQNNQNTQTVTKKQNYTNVVKGLNQRYSSNTRLKQLLENNKCNNSKVPIYKKALNSGIKNDPTLLIYNKNIPFYSQL